MPYGSSGVFLYESLQTHFLRAEALRKSAMAKQ